MIRKRAFFKCLSIVGAIALGAPAARCQDGAGGQQFVRGDPDGDGVQSITDAIVLLGCLFLGTVCPTCADAADVNDDGLNDITDAVYLLSFIFGGGPESPAPIGDCGPDPTADDLGCASFPRCALIDPDA